MADFVPFRSGKGFRPHVFADQIAPLVEDAVPEAVSATRPEPVASVPDHSAGVSGARLDRSMPLAAGDTADGSGAQRGPTEEELAQLVADAEAVEQPGAEHRADNARDDDDGSSE